MDIEDQKTITFEEKIVYVEMAESARLGFIRKVYSLLGISLFITATMVIASMNIQAIQVFMFSNLWLLITLSIIYVILSIIFFCCCPEVLRKVPYNYIILFTMVFILSYIVSAVCASYVISFTNGTIIVIMAASLTIFMVIGLTAYAFYTKKDFTIYGSLLFVCGFMLAGASLLFIFYNNDILSLIFSFFGVVLFSFYLIYDTQLIVGKGKHKLSHDDYVQGTLALFIDIINIFLDILKILGALTGNR